MINTVTVTNHLGESLTIDLRFPEKSGFLIRGIDGLGPGKADITTVQMMTMDGATFNSSRVNTRNIVFTIEFMDNPTIEETRRLTYKYFPIKKKITLRFDTDTRICEIDGYVEANEPVIFSKREGTNISIICPDPYFHSVETMSTMFSGIESAFEFPLINDSLASPLLIMGFIQTVTFKSVYYSGDASTGLVIHIHAIGTAHNIRISNARTYELMSISSDRLIALTGSDIVAGDEIIISTVRGNKYIQLLRNGATTNILNCLDKNADWFQLERGDNLFAYTADSGLANLSFVAENDILYEGA